MGYLIAELWPFLIVALLIGVVTGWLSVSSSRS